ncbi:MAG: FecR domain-containing protein [Sphingomonadales bacterium]|nr:FecR domain-containing protein [Sphingomonadales bacterium]MDE2168427.1 FecR domain-containing protein [Sphingomonadales bacterium]
MESSPTAPLQKHETEAIRHLLALENGASEAERAQAERWIAASPAHAVAFAQARAAWRATAELDAEPEVGSCDIAPAFAHSSRRGVLLGAAGALGMALAAMAGFRLWRDRQLHTTGIGETRDLSLPDGSHVALNSDSALEVAYTPQRRLLKLRRGEAFFDVAHNPARPFDVEVGDTTLRALGTAFNVRDRGAVVELTVAHGVVGVREGLSALHKVPAGNFAIIHPGAVAVAAYDAAGLSQKTAWREHTIELNGSSLAQAVEEFNRYRVSPIVIGDQRVAALRVGGRFQTDESGLFIESVEQSMPVRAMKDSDGGVLLLYSDEVSAQ